MLYKLNITMGCVAMSIAVPTFVCIAQDNFTVYLKVVLRAFSSTKLCRLLVL